MKRWIKTLFFGLLVRPLVLIILGLNIRHRERLIGDRPSILVANHNSHLDTLVIMSLFPLKAVHRIRPVAAADYFMKNRLLAWFATEVIGIIPLERQRHGHGDPLAPIDEALQRGESVIIFPEGSRGSPEQRQQFKTGVAHLARRHPKIPVQPLFLHGLGKALPRGEGLLVPFFCDLFVGTPLYWCGERQAFMDDIEGQIAALASELDQGDWS